MKQTKINKCINIILIIFLLIQPIFDIKIFYNSISTLIRVVIICILFLYYFCTSESKKKYWLLIYPAILGIYFVFHHLNALSFHSLIPGNFNYSIIQEMLYFLKMITPYLLIYNIYKADFGEETVITCMQGLVLIISLTIIISNLFGFSYGNYSDTIIKANFFEWVNNDSTYTYMDLASKGIFEYGNQIGAILIMFLPFSIYMMVEKHKLINFITAISNIFALILLCTRVSVLGIFIVTTYTFFTYAFVAVINKKQFSLKSYFPIVLILIMHIALLPINPMFSRLNERENVIQAFNENQEIKTENPETVVTEENLDQEQEIVEENIKEEPSNHMIEYIETNYKNKKLHEQFLFNNYPYKYDTEFWYEFLQKDISLTTDYRYIEISMVKRVVEINNNKMDKLFGITNTRLQNIFNIEKDFVVQYYALGIVGIILIFLPYAVILASFAYRTIVKKFKNLSAINLLAGITILFMFAISYFSGNLLNSLSFTIYFALCFYLLKA